MKTYVAGPYEQEFTFFLDINHVMYQQVRDFKGQAYAPTEVAAD